VSLKAGLHAIQFSPKSIKKIKDKNSHQCHQVNILFAFIIPNSALFRTSSRNKSATKLNRNEVGGERNSKNLLKKFNLFSHSPSNNSRRNGRNQNQIQL
jgi:hypothetical protein